MHQYKQGAMIKERDLEDTPDGAVWQQELVGVWDELKGVQSILYSLMTTAFVFAGSNDDVCQFLAALRAKRGLEEVRPEHS
jgi:hypothetical protein